MSVEQLNTVDFISKDLKGRIVLTISDHLSWQEDEHFLILQDKVNSYLRFIEGGQMYKDYPDASGREVIIDIVMKYKPTEEAVSFLEKVKNVIVKAGFDLCWGTLE